MRCPACEYALWNLLPGPCPECGRAFRSDEFEFEPGSVAFLCGACGQEYFGTDSKGLLVPRTFACVACGAACDCGAMAVAPTDRIDPLADRGLLPWIDRSLDSDGRPRRGFFNRFFATVWWFTSRGWKAVDGIPREASAGAAWTFLLVVVLASSLVALVPIGLFMAPLFATYGRANPITGLVLPLAIGAVAYLAWCLLTPLVTSLLAHGLLLVTGRCRDGLGRTMQGVLYPSAVTLWAVVPFCWPLSSGAYIWSAVIACGAVKRLQQVSWWRACLAVVLPTLVVSFGVPLMFFLGLAQFGPGRVLGPIPGGPPPVPQAVVGEAESVADAGAPAGEEAGETTAVPAAGEDVAGSPSGRPAEHVGERDTETSMSKGDADR
jgi:hypothetical protein